MYYGKEKGRSVGVPSGVQGHLIAAAKSQTGVHMYITIMLKSCSYHYLKF